MRHICYITGTRADFGLMTNCLKAIDAHADLSLSLMVTGMHLSHQHGFTMDEITNSGLAIRGQVPLSDQLGTGASMVIGIAQMIQGFTALLDHARPDALLLLGDRGEMLAGALVGLHLNIPIVHIHGGERSGTVDEPIRHAISKLSHFHFVATEESQERLVRMGEKPQTIHVIGAPGLDGLLDEPRTDRQSWSNQLGFSPHRPIALFLYHPVVQEADTAGIDAGAILSALEDTGCQILALMPNSDVGGEAIREVLSRSQPGLIVRTHLERRDFLDAMANADLMVGNSSSGIIEAASFGTPVLNIGSRQNLRQRNDNITDVSTVDDSIGQVITSMLAAGRFKPANVYGDGKTAPRVAELLATLPLGPECLSKVNSY